MENSAIVFFNMLKRNERVEIEIPLDITANDLVIALNNAYNLGIDISNMKKCHLKTENPIALLRGNKLLSEYGLYNGTIINYTE